MPPWEEDPVTYYSPQFGGSPRPATWTPPQPPATTAGWSPPARRVIVAHAVLWPGAIFLDASARWWLPPFNDVVRNGDSAGWTNAFQQIAFGGILSIPLIVALLMLGRSLARMLVSTALVLLAIGIGSSGYLWLDFQGPLARGVFIGAATSALMLAWIAARRRTMLGLLAVLISLVVPILIKVLHIGPETHAIVWDGQFDLGPALAQFAAFAFAMCYRRGWPSELTRSLRPSTRTQACRSRAGRPTRLVRSSHQPRRTRSGRPTRRRPILSPED